MTALGPRAMRADAMFATLAGAAVVIVAAATLVSLQLLAPPTGAVRLFDAGVVSLDRLAAATRL
jgi:hypothetical protein